MYGHLFDFGLFASSIGLVSKENPHNSVLYLYHCMRSVAFEFLIV